MAEQSDQDKESKGGLPGLEWVLKHQGWFLVVAIPTSFLVTVAVIKYVVIPLVEESLPVKGTANNVGGFTDTPVLSLALLVASITFAVTIWRGYQTYEQIRKAREQIDEAQKQFNQARFQNALQMATERENAGRCISGLRVLEDMYEDLIFEDDKETVHSVALYVLSLPKPDEEGDWVPISRSARQRALDILVSKEFLSQDNLEKSDREKGSGRELPVRDSMVEKDLSRLHFVRRSQKEDVEGRKILNLSKFSFRNCLFYGANFSDVNFSRADFRGCTLFAVNLTRTNLIGVKGLAQTYTSFTYCLESPQIRMNNAGEECDESEAVQIQSWGNWKEYVANYMQEEEDQQSSTYAIRHADEESFIDLIKAKAGRAWVYMKQLVEEDEDFPPGVTNPNQALQREGN